jgi:HK97 gp10 family phage protein
MAKIEMKMPEDFLLKLSRLGDKTDEIIPKVLEAGGEVVLAKAKSNLSSVVGRGTKLKSRSTGELEDSSVCRLRSRNGTAQAGISKLVLPSQEAMATVNAKIANILEYGKHGQPPKPFMRPAADNRGMRLLKR